MCAFQATCKVTPLRKPRRWLKPLAGALLVVGCLAAGGAAWRYQHRQSPDSADPPAAFPVRMITYSANYCAACQRQDVVLRAIVEKYGNRVSVEKVVLEQDLRLPDGSKLNAVPTTVVLANGVETKRMTGYQSERSLAAALRRAWSAVEGR